MAIVTIKDVGSIGFIPDIPPHELPVQAWSGVKNIRFSENSAKKFLGHTQIFGTPGVSPIWHIPIISEGSLYWIYAGTDKVYVTDGVTHKDISNGTYIVTEDVGWTGGILNGVPILNPGVSTPQMWNPVDFATPQMLSNLTAWPAATQARVMRPFLYYMVAYNVTKNGVQHPYMVKWSHTADPGTVPTSWDHTDPTKDAGEVELAETNGEIVEALPMRNINVVYKTDSVWAMRFVGGNDIFAFEDLFREFGALSRRCIKDYLGRHVVFGFGDIIIHDGQQAESIVNNRTRRWLFNQIDGDSYKTSFVTYIQDKKEMWFCFPEVGESRPTSALVWNIREDTFGHRELPNAAHADWGVLDINPSEVWDTDTQEWDQDLTVWNQQLFNPVDRGLMVSDPNSNMLWRMDDTNQFNGQNVQCFLERVGLPVAGRDRRGELVVDYDSVKFVSRIRPKMTSTGPVQISVGSQMQDNDPVTWKGPKSFNPVTDFELYFEVTGRLIAVRFESNSNISWNLHSYDLDVYEVSRY